MALLTAPGVTEPWDVWYEWQDACDHVAAETATGGLASAPASRPQARSSVATTQRKDRDDEDLDDATQDRYEDDGFIERDDEDAEADYDG